MTTIVVMFFLFPAMGQASFERDSLKSILRSNADDHKKLEVLTELASIFLSEQSYDSSIFYCDTAIRLAVKLGETGTRAGLNAIKGKALFYSQGPERSIDSYKESYTLYSSTSDSAGMAAALNGMGVMYQKLGHNDSALSCYIQLAIIAEKKGYEKTLGMGYLNMGILYQYNKEFDKAFHYLDLSIPLNINYRDDLVGVAHMNKGLIFYSMKEFDSTLIRYRQAYNILKDWKNSKNLADLFNNFGNLYLKWKNLDSAEYYHTKAKEMYVLLGDWYTFCQVYHNLALIAIDRGEYDKSIMILDSCLAIARETGNIDLESLAYRSKHSAYIRKGDYLKSLENYLLHDSLDHIIYNIDKDEMMADMEMKYQNEQKQAQILTLERDNLKKSKQNNIYLFTGIGIIALITFAFLYFRQRATKDRIIARQRIRQLEEEKKLLAAKSLVEGQEEERKRIAREIHDGLGVLLSTTRMHFSTISVISPEAGPLLEKAAKMLEQASSDVRKISHNMMPGLLTKLGLYEAVEDLFEKIAETEGMEVHTEIPEDLERMTENREIMIYRIIQELANNTLKHAGAKSIRISMQMHSGQLEVNYSDDGQGFNFEEKLDSKSIGLKSIQSRINFLNGTMEVNSEAGQGTSFRLLIPSSTDKPPISGS